MRVSRAWLSRLLGIVLGLEPRITPRLELELELDVATGHLAGQVCLYGSDRDAERVGSRHRSGFPMW